MRPARCAGARLADRLGLRERPDRGGRQRAAGCPPGRRGARRNRGARVPAPRASSRARTRAFTGAAGWPAEASPGATAAARPVAQCPAEGDDLVDLLPGEGEPAAQLRRDRGLCPDVQRHVQQRAGRAAPSARRPGPAATRRRGNARRRSVRQTLRPSTTPATSVLPPMPPPRREGLPVARAGRRNPARWPPPGCAVSTGSASPSLTEVGRDKQPRPFR